MCHFDGTVVKAVARVDDKGNRMKRRKYKRQLAIGANGLPLRSCDKSIGTFS